MVSMSLDMATQSALDLVKNNEALLNLTRRLPEVFVSDMNWWVVVKEEGVDIHQEATGLSNKIMNVGCGWPVFCLKRSGSWLEVSDESRQRSLGWLRWKSVRKMRWRLNVKPLTIVEVETNYLYTTEHGEEMLPAELPEEALDWTYCDIDVFYASRGELRPARDASISRTGKSLLRSLRLGPFPVELRVSERNSGEGGAFALANAKAETLIELCPLLRITEAAARLSEVLKRLHIQLPPEGETRRVALPLGFGRVYAASMNANLRWSFYGEEDIALWTSRDVFVGDELTVNLDGLPVRMPEAVQQELDHSMEHLLENVYSQQLVKYPLGKLAQSGTICHRTSQAHGRGVFATRDFAPGELIECSPAVLLDEVGAKAMVSYRWGLETGSVEEPEFFLPLGLGGLYNHFEPPHARGKLDKTRSVLEIYADRDIRRGHEIFVTYGDTYFDDDFASLGHSRAGYKAPSPPEAIT